MPVNSKVSYVKRDTGAEWGGGSLYAIFEVWFLFSHYAMVPTLVRSKNSMKGFHKLSFTSILISYIYKYLKIKDHLNETFKNIMQGYYKLLSLFFIIISYFIVIENIHK
jgi:hypothetical protein